MKKWFLILLSLSYLCMAQANLWTDREFDATGVKTEAHSGEKAGYFTVSKQTRWASFRPTTLKIEPYAVYRATAWVKCEKGSDGSIHALYTYGWNSFGWDFQFRVPLKPDGEWHQVSVDFWGPDERHDFLPLVAEGSSNAKVWIDELEIVKIKSGADHIAQLQKLARPTSYMARLLARFYQRQGDLNALKKLAADTDPVSRADIDCLIVRHKMDPDNALDYITDMIANGGLNTPRGPQELKELMASLSFEQRATVLAQAFLKGGNVASARKAWDAAVGDLKMTERLRLSEIAAKVSKLDALNQMFQEADDKKLLPPDVAAAWYRICYRILMDFERKRANLGRRVVEIDGVALRADTHVIVLPEEPTPSEQFAAEDLAYHLEEMTGQSLEILVGPESISQYPIFVGRNRLLEKYGFTVDYQKLGGEGIHVESNRRNHALLLGGGQRGVMYSVYTLLDDFLGCRWFALDCTYIPKAAETVALNNLKKIFVPYLEQRDANYTCNRPPEFGVRNKLNGESIRADEKWGDHIKYCGFVHNFDKLVPSAVYGAEHPEYYSEINGKRVTSNSQLCLTNPDVLRIAMAAIRKNLKERPDAQIYSVSMNDNINYCRCSKCMALAEKEGSHMGPMLHFVNAIANDIAKDYPDKIISTDAYHYTRKPPKHVKPAPNVAIRLSSIECCFAHPMETCPFNQSFVKDIRDWAKICNRLHIWDYVINYGHNNMPFPNFRVLAPNIDFFLRNHATSVFEEANYFSDGGEFAELRSYVVAKLLWEPTYDVDKAIREFTDHYYGKAAPFIREYLRCLHDEICSQKDLHITIYSPPKQYLNEELMTKATALFQQAQEAVKDEPTHLFRVQVAYLPIIYTRQMLSRLHLVDGKLVANADNSKELELFEKIARKANITKVAEKLEGRLENWLSTRRSRQNGLEVVTLKNDILSVDVLPELGGHVWRVRLADGLCILRTEGDDTKGYLPYDECNGYEEYSKLEYRSAGWEEPFTVKAKGKDFVEMEATLKDGVIVRRRVELAGNSFKVASKYTSDTLSGKRAFRTHPVFSVPRPQDACLTTWRADGTAKRDVLSRLRGPAEDWQIWLRDAWDVFLQGANKPQGRWQLSYQTADGRQCVITNTFNPEDVNFCYLHLSLSNQHITFEQWSTARELTPTDGPSISNTYTIDVK